MKFDRSRSSRWKRSTTLSVGVGMRWPVDRLVDTTGVVKAETARRMRIQKADLTLELRWIRPIVVAVQERQIFALGRVQQTQKQFIGAQTLIGEDESHTTPESAGDFLHDRPGTIPGMILSDDDLVGEARVLSKDTFDRLPHIALVVVRLKKDADLQPRAPATHAPPLEILVVAALLISADCRPMTATPILGVASRGEE